VGHKNCPSNHGQYDGKGSEGAAGGIKTRRKTWEDKGSRDVPLSSPSKLELKEDGKGLEMGSFKTRNPPYNFTKTVEIRIAFSTP
jgi:hypothetical protein